MRPFCEESMKKWVWIVLVSALITLPGVCFGLSFDIWETGMSINEVVSLARQHNIPIARDGLTHDYKKFDRKLIDGNFYKASTLYYRTTLFGRDSVVYLRLTDDSKFVREIEVRLSVITDRESFTEEMVRILDQKYGPHKEVKEPVVRFYRWRPDRDSQVRRRLFGPEASIIYTDLRIQSDFEDQPREKVRKSTPKDSDKF